MNKLKKCKHKNHIGNAFITIDNFGTDKQKKDKLKSYCNNCCKRQYSLYYQTNKEKNKEYQSKYRESHKDERAKYANGYYKTYYPANKHKYVQYVANRRAAKLKATPKWYELIRVRNLYEQCSNKTKDTGVQHHIDRIIPLQHPQVCGLHYIDNLQIITKVENLEKGNKLIQR